MLLAHDLTVRAHEGRKQGGGEPTQGLASQGAIGCFACQSPVRADRAASSAAERLEAKPSFTELKAIPSRSCRSLRLVPELLRKTWPTIAPLASIPVWKMRTCFPIAIAVRCCCDSEEKGCPDSGA